MSGIQYKLCNSMDNFLAYLGKLSLIMMFWRGVSGCFLAHLVDLARTSICIIVLRFVMIFFHHVFAFFVLT